MNAEAGPMAPENCALNTAIIFAYLRKYHHFSEYDLRDLVDDVRREVPSQVINLDTGAAEEISLEQLADERYWISNQFTIHLYQRLEELIPDSRLGYRIGLKSTELAQVKRSALGVTLVGIDYVLRRVGVQMMKWNRSKQVDVERRGPGHLRIRLIHHPGIIVTPFAMDVHQGIFAAYAQLAGYQDVQVTYVQVEDPEREIYDFDVRFSETSLGRRLVRYLLSRLPYTRQLQRERDQAIEESDLLELKMKDQIRDLERLIDQRTEQYRLEKERAEQALQELQRTQARLIEAEKLAAVGRLSFGVGHDLRNTLATATNSALPQRRILADAEEAIQMLEDDRVIPEVKQYVERRKLPRRLERAKVLYETMMNSLNQALDNVKALEGFAVQDSSDFQPVRVEAVIQKVLRDHQNDLDDILVETDFEKASYQFQANPLKLYDIFQNLVLNAIEAMAKTAEPRLRITTQLTPERHVTTVEDNGIGMREEQLRHVFEPFFTTKELVAGRQRGLGMFNVWRLVEQHGGKIRIESEAGYYTRVLLRFPLTS
jgi:signal transduction histidine kinase